MYLLHELRWRKRRAVFEGEIPLHSGARLGWVGATARPVAVLVRGKAVDHMNRELGALKGNRWHCIPCWALMMGRGQDAYPALARVARSPELEKLKDMHEVIVRELPEEPGAPAPEVLCDIEGPECDKRLAGPTKYNGWNLSVRRKPEPE